MKVTRGLGSWRMALVIGVGLLIGAQPLAWAKMPTESGVRRPTARAPKVHTEVKNGWVYKYTIGAGGRHEYKSGVLYDTIGPVRYVKAERTFRMTPTGKKAVTSHTVYGINGKPKIAQSYRGTHAGGNVLASRSTDFRRSSGKRFLPAKTVNYMAGKNGDRVIKNFERTKLTKAGPVTTTYGPQGKPRFQERPGKLGGKPATVTYQWNGKADRWVPQQRQRADGKGLVQMLGKQGKITGYEGTKLTKAGPVTTTYGPQGKPRFQERPAKLNGKPATTAYSWSGKRWVPQQRMRNDGKGPIHYFGPRGKLTTIGTDVRTVKGNRVPFVRTELGKDRLKETVWYSKMTKNGPVTYKAEVFDRKNGKPVSVGVFPVKNNRIVIP